MLSEAAEAALATLRSSGADLKVESLGPGHFHDEQQQAAMRILREGVEWLQARQLDAQGQLVFGDSVGHIVTCARTLGVDLIVVGHRHRYRSPVARWWSEDEDATLMERAPCSILVALGPAANA